MTKITSHINDRAFVRINGIGPGELFVKLESLNAAGSIKLKAALGLIGDLERRGRIDAKTRLIESSSGNLGVALATVCAERGYHFTCVIDPNTSSHNRKIIEALGGQIETVTERDENGGYLHTRIRHIERIVARDDRYIWLNQYANPANPLAHVETTARSISESFERLDYVFIGAGTTGTLMGCKQYLSKYRPETKIVAVDSVGSVTFGFPAGRRHIPGLGTSRRPEIFDPQGLHAIEMVPESSAVTVCRWLARTHGVLSGGSTGTVLAAVHAWRNRLPADSVVVALSPDGGERYLDTIYSDDWVVPRFGDIPLAGNIKDIESIEEEL